jgi:hypothetical protein
VWLTSQHFERNLPHGRGNGNVGAAPSFRKASRARTPDSPCRARVRADAAFSTRYTISSNRSNDQPGMAELGRLAMDGVMSPERPGRRRTYEIQIKAF